MSHFWEDTFTPSCCHSSLRDRGRWRGKRDSAYILCCPSLCTCLSLSFLYFSICRFHPDAMPETSTPRPCKRSEHGVAACITSGVSHSSLSSIYSLFTFLASLKRQIRTVGKGPSGGAGAPVNGTVIRTAEEKTAEYAVFALVPVFCIMGLLGILICNILKKKGYRCSSDKEGGDEETATPQKEGKIESFQFYSTEC